MSKNKVLNFLKLFGFTVLGGSTLIGCGTKTNQPTFNSNGLPLIAEGAHMQKGEHKYVITEQFYEFVKDETEQKQDMAMNGLKEAYANLDKYTSGLNLKLCTTVDTLAETYNIPKIDSIGEQDIALYITNEAIDNDFKIMTKTNYSYDSKTKEMKDMNITFKQNYVFGIWNSYETLKETLNPYNTAVYTNALYTSMQTMGFSSIQDHESIMNNNYARNDTPHDLTDYDIELLDKYCVNFYNVESTLKTNYANNMATVEDNVL